MSSMLASTLRRAATQPKPASLGGPLKGERREERSSDDVIQQGIPRWATVAIATNIRRNCVTDAPEPRGKSFKDAWLSDKGAWPVIGVIGFAVVFSTTFLLRTTFFHPDVRIDRKSRCTTVREQTDK